MYDVVTTYEGTFDGTEVLSYLRKYFRTCTFVRKYCTVLSCNVVPSYESTFESTFEDRIFRKYESKLYSASGASAVGSWEKGAGSVFCLKSTKVRVQVEDEIIVTSRGAVSAYYEIRVLISDYNRGRFLHTGRQTLIIG